MWKKLILCLCFSYFLTLTVIGQGVFVQWENLVNVSYIGSNQKIQKSTPTTNWDAWARSTNVCDFGEKATLSYNVEPNPTSSKNILIALGEYTSTYSFSQVQFGFQISGNQVIIIEGGAPISFFQNNDK